jgi:Imelysin
VHVTICTIALTRRPAAQPGSLKRLRLTPRTLPHLNLRRSDGFGPRAAAFLSPADQLQEAGGVEANVATGYHAVEFLLWG